MMFLKRAKTNTERGASSVLVIFLMVVLVSFGILAITSAAANMRLGKKVLSFREEYYQMDMQAEEVVDSIDARLYDAEMAAREKTQSAPADFAKTYMQEAMRRMKDFSYDGVPITLHEIDDSIFVVEFTVSHGEESAELGKKHLTAQLAVRAPEYAIAGGSVAMRRDNARRYYIAMWMQWQDDFTYEYQDTRDMWRGILEEQEKQN